MRASAGSVYLLSGAETSRVAQLQQAPTATRRTEGEGATDVSSWIALSSTGRRHSRRASTTAHHASSPPQYLAYTIPSTACNSCPCANDRWRRVSASSTRKSISSSIALPQPLSLPPRRLATSRPGHAIDHR
ncbi:hypothetical protein EJ03DRAFT_162421 [Teratosphaeria nubilosa]|uniref:Uncharacterized protein n=1 Tax=Teratosphaeria nubilosa TaxID=161662 RepID=A0A6G1L2Q9_9PEZI|nr:hypothetical protein EJ03DRAFT_162421 [Teratosphaeria nubilosa]